MIVTAQATHGTQYDDDEDNDNEHTAAEHAANVALHPGATC